MKVQGKSIRSVTRLVAAAQGCEEIKIVYKISEETSEVLEAIGFDVDPEVGDYLIPQPVGKVTAKNAYGKDIIRKDLPMEPEPRSYHRTWKDWHGQEHSGIQTRYINMYPREYQPAEEETLHIIQINDDKYVSTDSLVVDTENESRNIHISNLMLECFGGFEIVDAKEGSIIGAKVKQLHWDILPPGEYPWARAKPLVGEVTKRLKDSEKGVVESRMQSITRYNPDFLATGRAGFSGYFIYGFATKGIYILESIHLDNATYVFGDDWERLSKLTKNQIINGDIEHQRIIHDNKWNREIRSLLVGRI
ncbi:MULTISPECIES: hypothetical protein [Shewanella]|uniref:Uncharacterized protein n=1 Tax=Shewanella marisflavi TaxID=260364 RepID=A0ABX5WN82_9GAMM|nr:MULTISPECIES: hypothetical protein [Shewanella]QDF74656.1 hypothetical protein FGA12_05525 [Shewanella marisflavi]